MTQTQPANDPPAEPLGDSAPGHSEPPPPPDDSAGPAPSICLPDGSPARPPEPPPRVHIEIHQLGEAARVHFGDRTIEGSPEDLVGIIQILSKAAMGCFQRRFAIQQQLMADMAARAAAESARQGKP